MPATHAIALKGRGLIVVANRPLGLDCARVGAGMILPETANISDPPAAFPRVTEFRGQGEEQPSRQECDILRYIHVSPDHLAIQTGVVGKNPSSWQVRRG